MAKCTKCDAEFNSLAQLVDHTKKVHQVVFKVEKTKKNHLVAKSTPYAKGLKHSLSAAPKVPPKKK